MATRGMTSNAKPVNKARAPSELPSLLFRLALAIAAAGLVGWWLGGRGLSSDFVSKLPWYTSRAAGVTAYLLLSASTIAGLAISVHLLDRWPGRATVFALHEHLSWLALGFVGLHVGTLLLDSYEPFSLMNVLVPFTSHYRPVSVGLGIIGAYLLGLIVASFYVRARIGQRAWRAFHFASFGLYGLATIHGILAGNSTGMAWMAFTYLGSGGLVLFLTLYRLLRSASATTPADARRPGSATQREPR